MYLHMFLSCPANLSLAPTYFPSPPFVGFMDELLTTLQIFEPDETKIETKVVVYKY